MTFVPLREKSLHKINMIIRINMIAALTALFAGVVGSFKIGANVF